MVADAEDAGLYELNVLASPGQGCPEFARQCRALR
jgi:hypothetical protein